MRHLLPLLALWILSALTGCSTTVFASLPTGSVAACDPAWPGYWSVLDDEKPEPDVVEISADCRSVISKGKAEPMYSQLVTTAHGQYLLPNLAGESRECIDEGKAHCGHALMRYDYRDDTIRVYFPDHARIAAAIAQGAVDGYTAPQDPKRKPGDTPVYQNFVAGDGDAIERLLARHPEFFLSEPAITLKRSKTPPQAAPPATQPAASEH